jgi:hypothetical protein
VVYSTTELIFMLVLAKIQTAGEILDFTTRKKSLKIKLPIDYFL